MEPFRKNLEFKILWLKKNFMGTSLVVQWLRLRAPNAGGLGSIPGQGARSHVPQLRVCMRQLKIPPAATKNKNLSFVILAYEIKLQAYFRDIVCSLQCNEVVTVIKWVTVHIEVIFTLYCRL